MALWFKKEKKESYILEFNRDKLQHELQNLSSKLSEYKVEIGVQIIEEVMKMFYNLNVLDRPRDSNSFLVQQGRLSAFTDLISYIERSKNFKPKEQEANKPRDAIRTIRRTDNQASAAI